ncbi:4Fe-4S dicluster domain-containing protein [Bordetella genomosp. 10]|nr:4Fe-4S dicluster domain-containing protein [Bordetella genomosp. 10]
MTMDRPRTIPILPVHGSQAGEAAAGGAPDAPASPSRRVLLKWMAVATALAGAGCSGPPEEAIVPYAHMPEGGPGNDPVFYASAVTRAGYALPVLVETHDGRPTKIEGNPRHPMSMGSTDARTQAALWQLWDPDRSDMVRRGEAVSGWDAAREALLARRAAMAARGGAGLRVLTGHVTSPTLLRQLDALAARYPGMRWHRHDPAYPAAAEEGARRALGRPAQPMYRLEHARVVVTLGADIFVDTPAGVRLAREFARGRGEPRAEARTRLYAIEAMPGLTGAMADQRWPMNPAEMGGLVEWLAAELGVGGAANGKGDGNEDERGETHGDAHGHGDDAHGHGDVTPAWPSWAHRLVDLLRGGVGNAVLVAGPSLPAEAHALAWAINARLGAVGKFVTPVSVRSPAGLGALVEAMRAGDVETLMVLDVNPVYDAPGKAAFADALRRVPWSMHVGLYRDETARACAWHVPRAHELETWSDALAWDGTATIQQPMIAPLHGGISPHTVLQVLVDGEDPDALAVVKRTWQARWGGASGWTPELEQRWQAALRNGYVDMAGQADVADAHAPDARASDARAPDAQAPDAAAPIVSTAPTAPAVLATPTATLGKPAASSDDSPASQPSVTVQPTAQLTVQLLPDPYLGAGDMANNAWLQELPRPLTRLTWDNAAFMGPDTARKYQLDTGDVVTLTAVSRDAGVDAPVHVLPGHAEGVVTLHLGYGRRNAGSVGTGVGVDAYALQDCDARGDPLPTVQAVLARTGRRHAYAHVQTEMSMHGRDIVRVEDLSAPPLAPTPEPPSLYPKVDYPDYAWAMTIDLDQCIGCNACTVACQAENNIPVVGAEQVMRGRVMHWIRVDVYREDEDTLFQPVPCMHCEDAPCEAVCPVGATVHDSEGLNAQVYNRCVGTRFCSNNCPYKVRRFNFFDFADHGEAAAAHQNPDVTVRQRGVMEKCTYCVQRISRARIQAQKENRELRDGEVVTACQAACPTQAIVFGNLNDPDSQVAASRASPRAYALLEELNTRPRTRYLARREDRAARLEPDDA